MSDTLQISFACPPMALRQLDADTRETAQESMDCTVKDGNRIVYRGIVTIKPTLIRRVLWRDGRERWRVDACVGISDAVHSDLPFEPVWLQWWWPWMMPTMVAQEIQAPTKFDDGRNLYAGDVTYPRAPLMWWSMTIAAVVAQGTLTRVG